MISGFSSWHPLQVSSLGVDKEGISVAETVNCEGLGIMEVTGSVVNGHTTLRPLSSLSLMLLVSSLLDCHAWTNFILGIL